MSTRACTHRLAVLGLLGVTAGWGAAPAAAGTVYHWRTEDGTYAFTDDEKAIPERYRDQVETRQLGGLQDYKRYTPTAGSAKTGAPTGERASQPAAGEERLERLRALNAVASQPAAGGSDAPTITIRPGGDQGPVIDLAPGTADEPVVIETLRARPKGSWVTRSNVVVRQGDRVLTIIKPQLHETNVSSDIHQEEDFEGH